MITLTEPEYGWVTLEIDDGRNQCEIDFSDVGPDSIGQLQNAVEELRAGKDSCAIEFNLEPSWVLLRISRSKTAGDVTITINGELTRALTCDAATFIAELDHELARIVPLCVDPAWTNPGQI